MKKSHNFIVPLVVYPFDIMFSVGETDKSLLKAINKRIVKEEAQVFIDDEGMFSLSETKLARTVHSLHSGQTIVRFKKEPSIDIVAHEVFHAVDFILRRVGIELAHNSCEAYAYALQYVIKEFYYNLNLKK